MQNKTHKYFFKNIDYTSTNLSSYSTKLDCILYIFSIHDEIINLNIKTKADLDRFWKCFELNFEAMFQHFEGEEK